MVSSLFLTLVVAKLWGAVENGASLDLVSIPVYLWQDAAIVLGFAGWSTLVRPRWLIVAPYAGLITYTAVNVGVLIASGAPLSASMLRAAGSALSDSVMHYLEPRVLGPVSVVAALGVLGPWLGDRIRRANDRSVPLRWGVTGLVLISVLGWSLSFAVPTRGLHRSGPIALLESLRPRLDPSADDTDRDWRSSPLDGLRPLVSGVTSTSAARPSTVSSGVARGHNLVLIVLESVGAGYLHSYGAERDPMPFLTELAARSVQADHAYAVYPESIKGFVPLIASRYPAFDTTPESYELPFATLASSLKQAGYATALYHSGRFDYLGMRSVIEGRGFDELVDAAAISGVLDSSFGVDERSTVDRMLGDLDHRTEERPFFFAYLPIAGHHPYDAPEAGPYRGEEEFSDYLNALRYADRSIQTLYEGIRDRGLADETVFVVVGDHGQAFAQHPGNYGHVFFLYEENIRIPLWFHVPGLERGERWSQPVSVIDLAPTVVDLLGVDPPAEWQGRSLLESPTSRVALFFTDYSLGLVGARDGNWKLVHEIDSGRDELFDLESDPDERIDLSTPHPEIAARLREHALAWVRSQRSRHLDR